MDATTTVLVVDDDEDIATLMRDFLEADGYRVITASDGPGGLDALRENDVDCVLLDVMMPGPSGFEVLRTIRETSDVPVLFLSAKQEESDKLRGLGLGGDDYIVKSSTPAEIVARIKAVLRRSQRESSGRNRHPRLWPPRHRRAGAGGPRGRRDRSAHRARVRAAPALRANIPGKS